MLYIKTGKGSFTAFTIEPGKIFVGRTDVYDLLMQVEQPPAELPSCILCANGDGSEYPILKTDCRDDPDSCWNCNRNTKSNYTRRF